MKYFTLKIKTVLVCFFVLFLSACWIVEKDIHQWGENFSGTILALGDSLTAWYGLPEAESYPSQLQKLLKDKSYNYRIINAWISWDTSAWLLSRIDWVLEGNNPSVAILCIGANDAFQGKSIEDIESNIRTIIERLKSKKIPILFAGMKAPLNLGDKYWESYEALFPRLADEYNLPYIPFLLQGVALKPEFNQEDRIHPTASWYAIVADTVYNALITNKLISK